LKLSQNNVYKETVKTFLAGIKIAWRIDPKLWHRVIIKPSFWEKISSELEEMAGWTKKSWLTSLWQTLKTRRRRCQQKKSWSD